MSEKPIIIVGVLATRLQELCSNMGLISKDLFLFVITTVVVTLTLVYYE